MIRSDHLSRCRHIAVVHLWSLQASRSFVSFSSLALIPWKTPSLIQVSNSQHKTVWLAESRSDLKVVSPEIVSQGIFQGKLRFVWHINTRLRDEYLGVLVSILNVQQQLFQAPWHNMEPLRVCLLANQKAVAPCKDCSACSKKSSHFSQKKKKHMRRVFRRRLTACLLRSMGSLEVKLR